MIYKSWLQKKDGEILGGLSFVTYEAEHGKCHYWAFYSEHTGVSLKSHRPFNDTEQALAHFEKHFGRIEKDK